MALRVAHQKLKELVRVFNSESGDGLLALSGIGVATRDKLLAKRSKAVDEGRTLRLSDVMGVDGIGASKLAAMTGEPTTADVIKYATYYTNLYGNQYPGSILSVDLGRVNSAYALIDNNLTVHKWKKVDLGMPKPYSPMTCCENVEEEMKGFPSADMLVVESQSHRNPAMKGFLGIGIELRILEAFIYAIAKTRLSIPVQSVGARMVAQYFGIGAQKPQTKKKAAIHLAHQFLSEDKHETPMGNKVGISDELKTYFFKEEKKDDLSDCLLQAIAVVEWGQMAKDLN